MHFEKVIWSEKFCVNLDEKKSTSTAFPDKSPKNQMGTKDNEPR